MGELRSVARAYALEGHPPIELVERMNGYHGALGADLMTTLLYAVFEVDTGRVQAVNAGHPPLLLVQADGTTRILRGSGPPLGVMDTWRYHAESASIEPGGAALIYTDGLVERRGEGIDAGLERLRSAVDGLGASAPDAVEVEPEEVCARLVAELADEAGVSDDVTLVVVAAEHRLGPRATLKLSPDMEALSASRRVLRRWLEEAGADAGETAEVVMAANEAWQNALEHGTGFARTTVDVDLRLHDRTIEVIVRDAGRRERSVADPDRGRGIDLMRALMDEVRLDLAPHGSQVRMRRELRDHEARDSSAERAFAAPPPSRRGLGVAG
jgi:anti-sigma regulatory factor (Ser/Thr protein kinase)